ncbi:double zinc ribbon domain-containing protein [Hyalangium gracile]|uniref:double zinc ribbon domain-containing protein n=1 Tax=Hyalangium gracile TaxID=394092 RepID=UPI001CCB4B95|nr:zinc ribbon domain-containing protein [Hyalangium gracile]
MITCRGCQAQNANSRRYCGRCGGTLASACSRCSFFNTPSDLFCGGCGQKIVEVRASQAPAELRSGSEKMEAIRNLSFLEMRDLLVTSTPQPPQPLQGEVSQSELDKLFGDEP